MFYLYSNLDQAYIWLTYLVEPVRNYRIREGEGRKEEEYLPHYKL